MNSPHLLDTWIGRSIGDRQRYRLDRCLGEGGMGYVFLAMDTLLGQQVALKLLKDTLVGSGELRTRFEREVALCAALQSNNIVQVTDYGVTTEGHPFFVMEYLQGQTLGQLLRRESRLPWERTVAIISQVCDGLQLAHTGVTLWRDRAIVSERVKVVHRDLKPDNIFLVPTALGELVKILDFGIAKIRDEQVENTNFTNMFIGTFRYAAPEQLGVAKDLDGRADIYSLGTILYEMLSGTNPFGLGPNINKIDSMSWALAHTSKLPVPLRSQPGCEHLSLELESVVMRCLQKAPNERFASVDELKQALRQLQQNTELRKEGVNEIEEQATHSEQETTLNIHRLRPLNQNTRRKLQQLGLRKEAKSEIEAKGTEKLVLDPTLPTKPKPNISPRLLRKATPVVVAVVVSALAYSTYQWQAHHSTQPQLNAQLSNPSHTFDQQLLSSAQALARTGNFKDAIATLSQMPQDSSLHSQAQSLLSSWSNHLLQQAQEQYQQAYTSAALEKALALTTAIPATSAIGRTAQATTAQWRSEWQHNEHYLQSAQSALQAGKWQEAINQANQVRLLGQQVKQGSPYWQNKLKPIVAKAEQLRAASQQTYSAPPPITYQRPAPPVTYQRPAPPVTYQRPAPPAQLPRRSQPSSGWTTKQL